MADIVDLLLQEHQDFRALFDELERTETEHREELFHELVARLAGHEAAEEALVHRTVRDHVPGGEVIAEELLAEESAAEGLLAAMERMDPSADEFRDALDRLRDEVLAHAEHEEHEEFPLLLAHVDQERRLQLGERFQRLRDAGPTRPHPLTPQTPEVRAATGPFVGLFDRARDAARQLFSDGDR